MQPYSYKADLAAPKSDKLPAAVRSYYLGASEAINPANPKLAKIAAELKVVGDSAQTVRNIAAWLKKNVTYKVEKGPIDKLDFKAADELVERGYAECRGYAILLTALCRAAGVPARQVWGMIMLPPGMGGFASHNWAEVYIAGVGWVPIDPQAPDTFGWLPTTHLRLFMDMRKNSRTNEAQPLINLIYMNGDKLRFEESREGAGKSTSPSR
jgi:transglutaminase-like putative cysteine protease